MNSKHSGDSVGQIIKNKRQEREITLEEVEFETKIKVKFLEAIENDNFEVFDSHTIAKGFIKNFSRYIGAPTEQVLAIYRRDVENKDMKRKIQVISDEPKKDKKENYIQIFQNRIREKVRNIELTRRKFLIFVSIILLSFIGLVLFQVTRATFDRPLLLLTNPIEIEAPYEGSLKLDQETVIIRGRTESNTLIKINDQIIPLNPDLSFQSSPISLSDEAFNLEIIAESNLGVTSKINLELLKQPLIITQINIDLKILEENTSLFISTDNIIRFDDFALKGSELNFQAERQIILRTNNPAGIELVINGANYDAQSEMTILNGGEKIMIQ
ncbi:MAG: hypothetical protein Kow0081_1900 [Candidatus Dojkabacteria bacterium]